jgi:hypothetical protein
MELLQILLCNLWSISRRIASDEHRSHHITMLCLDIVNHSSHLIQLFRANVGTVCEAKVDQRIFPLQVFLGEGLAVLVDELEGSADEWAADAFGVFGNALAGHAVFFVAEVEGHSYAGAEEETAGLPAKRSEAIARFCFFYGLVAHRRRLGKCAGGGLGETGRHGLGEALRRRADGVERALQSSSR